MNVRCPSCQTTFRVDPEKVPAAGVTARCSNCQATFRVGRAAAEPAMASPSPLQPSLAAAAAARPTPQPRVPEASRPSSQAPAPAPARPGPATSRPARPLPVSAPAAGPVPTRPAAAPGRRVSFRNQDPQARAQRIARALVSDIVAYNKDKLKEALEAGTLRTTFRDEIRKSWEEYVEQVTLDLAKQTPYFRDALNDILAKGQKLF